MNSNQTNPFKQLKEKCMIILDTMPLFLKFVIMSTIVLYLLNLLIPYVSLVLADIPYYTIYYCQLWRIFTTPFMTTNILSIIFSLFFWFKDAFKLEREIGTVKYLLIFFMNTFFIQLLYCLIAFLISLIIQNDILLKMKITPRGVRSEGLWPILLCDLTLLCLSNPNESIRFYFFPCIIKAKYYPLILFVIFTVLSGFIIDFEILCGIGFGFLYHYYLKNKIKVSTNFASKMENSFLFRWMKNKKGFINNGGLGSPELQNNLENIRNVNVSGNIDSTAQNDFKAFQGKGVALGGGDNRSDANNNYSTISIGSNDDNNSGDSRFNLNSSQPQN